MTRYWLRNDSRLDDDSVDELVRFAFDEIPAIERIVAVRVYDGRHPTGRAYWGERRPRWAGSARFAMSAAVPTLRAEIGNPRICWHSTALRRVERERGVDGAYAWLAEQAATGATRIGRWPIYRTDTVEEALLHTLAHEAMHVLAFDRERRRGRGSEILVEEAAARVLDAWRAR